MEIWRCGVGGAMRRHGAVATLQASRRLTKPLHCQHLVGVPANISGLAPRQGLLKLAGCPQILAYPSGGHLANVSCGTLITRCVGRGRDILMQLAT